ncbi:hypothetical protein VPH35_097650 [Triticum aestivum]|uniref:zinc finger BED domain-containing protein RICESLEEPER 3 n=1 Tax=Triticum aestivum TaxID=4565 RepID=UPI000843C5E3|nr:zinc finger BED domain-containing protein RICESLEEPER 3-like [Triticum aestivum]
MEEEPDNSNAMDEQEESTGSAPGPVFSGLKLKRLRSKVWDDFTPIYIDGKLARAECMHCHQVFSSGTGNLRKHQAKCTPRAQKRPMQHKPPFLSAGQHKSSDAAKALPQEKFPVLIDILIDTNEESQKVDQNLSHGELGTHEQKNLASCDTPTDKDRKNQSHEEPAVPDQDILANMNQKNLKVGQIEPHEELVRIFSVHGYPPSIQIHDRFCKFVASLNPMVKMPAKVDMYRYSRELFDKEKTKLKEKLASLRSRVCLSAYVWHYDLFSAFLCLSVHYIDDEWEKQTHIIRFRSVDPSCNAKQLSQDILNAIGDWGLRYKVFSITLDDAFLDDSVASDLKASLQEWNLRLANRSSCMSAKHTSSMSANRSLFVARSPTHLVNKVIHVGVDELHKVMEKSTKCSKYTKGHIPSAVRFLNCGYAPSAEEWSNAQRICKILQRLHIYMDEMNTCHCPADLLDQLWGAKRALHPEDSFYGDKTVSKELKEMQQKFTECWNLYCLNICLPVIMDPSKRLECIKSCLRPKLYNYCLRHELDKDIEDYFQEVHDMLINLFYEYSDQVEDTSITSGPKTSRNIVVKGDDMLMQYYHHITYPFSTRPMIELHQYLQEPGPCTAEQTVLQWWKEHSLTYPTIARMARDILAIPASTECGVAIRTARRTICQSSKHWVEETVCTQDWLTSYGSLSEMPNGALFE